MEGVMMKNLDRYRVQWLSGKPDHEIEVMTDEYKSLGSHYAVLGYRSYGVVNFGESLYIGLKNYPILLLFMRKRIMSRESGNNFFLQKNFWR